MSIASSLIENQPWELVDLSPNKKPIDCKGVFKAKRDVSGKIVQHKARLVIKGCAQKKEIDYAETYPPVVRYSFFLAMATKYNLDIDIFDPTWLFRKEREILSS